MRDRIFRLYIHLGPIRPTYLFYGLELTSMSTWISLSIRFPGSYFLFFLSRNSVLITVGIGERSLIHKRFWKTKRRST